MAAGTDKIIDMPVVERIEDFDRSSGNLLERMVFNHRIITVVICTLITVVLCYEATKLVFNASFEKMIPQSHPYIKNYMANKTELRGLGNSIRVVVANPEGDIFDPVFLETLRQINDELFLVPGVDRAWMKSLWTPSVRWNEVTENGFAGGPVIQDTYDGSPSSIEVVKENIRRAGITGSLVANDFKSALIFIPLLDRDPQTQKPLDYHLFSNNLEEIREKYQAPGETGKNGVKRARVNVHIIGFAKLVGDLIAGLKQVMTYFGIATLIAAIIIFLDTRCVRSTFLVIFKSVIGVSWQLGLISSLGFVLDPYSVLVPFLVFAIGVSHGLQKMNGIMQDVGRGTHRLVAARYTFRRLFLPGLTALLADAVGFAVLMFIDIPVIRELALATSIGVGVLIFTNLLLLPVMLSFSGVSKSAAARSLTLTQEEESGRGIGSLWSLLDRFTERRWATIAILAATLLFCIGYTTSRHLKIGDLDPGAPELRPDSRYNRDNAFITAHYSLSSDQFAVILKTQPEGCIQYESLVEADRLAWELKQIPGVQTTLALTDSVMLITSGTFEGSPKWYTLSRNQQILNFAAQKAVDVNPDQFNFDGSVMPVIAYLADHKAETLERVVAAVEKFSSGHNEKDRQFLLAAGNAGIEAVTNIVVEQANRTMMLYVYIAIIILCYITFRNWRAVVVAVLPLVVTSVLCEALMVYLGIGVKVATLPVTALGVGIGVDYALYLLAIQLAGLRAGYSLREAYGRALRFTGKVVALVGITLAAGVVTWAFSPIKFQADMGILLTFMFVWNMIGALIMIPALSHFLLNKVTVRG
ncbi:MAG: MMPL family transporter [Pseudomonadota bacterium]